MNASLTQWQYFWINPRIYRFSCTGQTPDQFMRLDVVRQSVVRPLPIDKSSSRTNSGILNEIGFLFVNVSVHQGYLLLVRA